MALPGMAVSKAAEIRRTILETAIAAGKGHIPPALSWVEIAVALFYGVMDHKQDRFVLSKTHGHLTLDAILADLNIVPDYPMWAGWPYKCSGSLGQGLGIAAGMALAAKLDNSPRRVFCMVGDAELHEGAIWEAAMFAAHHELSNLTLIIDDNQQACANFTRDILNVEPISTKFDAFGWRYAEIDGHNLEELSDYLAPDLWLYPSNFPLCLIARTVKGKGIGFMEGNPKWHHQPVTGDYITKAREALA